MVVTPPVRSLKLVNTIQLERVKRRWSQADLAGRAGIARNRISMLESGADCRPSAVALERIARAFGLRFDEVFSWQEGA